MLSFPQPQLIDGCSAVYLYDKDLRYESYDLILRREAASSTIDGFLSIRFPC
jgi:hypothetical protein